jgi:CRISPR-associated RAMP protein (TIGR02581 family)
LKRETILEGILENVGPLRVGMGREPSLEATVDLAVLRIPYGDLSVPYIPGSSLKGIFRNFAATLVTHKGGHVCPDNGCMQKLKEKFAEKGCLLCKIFGSQGFRGLVSFLDAYPRNERGEIYIPETGIRTGIKIGRKTGAVAGTAKYDVEYVEPGAKFRLQIRSLNLPTYALGLLSKVLLLLNEGEARVGGFKSRGFGQISIAPQEFRIKDDVSSQKGIGRLDEEDIEAEAELTRENGWLVATGERAWKVVESLAGSWDNFRLSQEG